MIFAFGDFELDEGRFELRRGGQAVAVQPKVLRLLLLLAARRHRAVSDAELLAELWPSETVGHGSIKRAVLGARSALGEHGAAAIRTIRGHGYQFVLPVVPPEPAAAPHVEAKRHESAAHPGAAFVGREAALAELDAAVRDLRAGHGGCVLVSGEPGIGKSRLLAEVGRRAAVAGARVWRGRCLELEGAPPGWPVLQVLREAVSSHSAAELRTLLGAGAPDVAEVFPELKQTLPDVPAAPHIGSAHARFRFLDSMTRFFARAARQQPLVLLFDDLQRADAQTLRLLLFMLGQLEAAAVLVVGTLRAKYEGDETDAHLFAELTRTVSARKLELAGLTIQELAHYLQLSAGDAAPPEIVAKVHEQTAGNPLFVEAMLRGTRGGQLARPERAERWAGLMRLSNLPGVRAAIDHHLATLPEPCRSLLASASVLGRDLPLALLAEVARLSVDLVVDTLDEATAAGVLQRTGLDTGDYRFTHALIRDALYEALPARQRAELHARAARALEARGAAWDQVELPLMAEHFLLAAPTHDGGKALTYLQRTAVAARTRMAYEDCAHHLDRALRLLDLTAPNAPERMQLLLERGEALTLASELMPARAALLKAVALARTAGDSDVMVQATRLLASPRETGHVDTVLVELLREALSTLPHTDPQTPCLRALLAKALSYAEHHDERRELVLSALPLAFEIADVRLRSETLQACHEALTDPEQWRERVDIAHELDRLSRRPHDQLARTELHAATTMYQHCLEQGDMRGVEAQIQRLYALADRVRDPLVRWYAFTFSAASALVAGQPEQAERYTKQAYELREVLGESFAYHQHCVQMVAVYRLTGRVAEAEAMARDISSRYPALAGWRSVVGGIDADQGRIEPARQVLDQLLADDLAALRRDPHILSAYCPAADLCTLIGDPALAKPLYDALLPYAEQQGTVSFGGGSYGPVALPLARLALRMGDFALAARHCEQGIAIAERMPSPLYVLIGNLTYAFVYLHSQDASSATRGIVHARRALAIAEAGNMQPLASHCRFLLSQFGDTPPAVAALTLN
jgi:DNA-binding winged helix-turn-helix (wHTH) protein/tetratricopeptide (TPR) repeat protein